MRMMIKKTMRKTRENIEDYDEHQYQYESEKITIALLCTLHDVNKRQKFNFLTDLNNNYFQVSSSTAVLLISHVRLE